MKQLEKELKEEYQTKLRAVQYRIEEIINCVNTVGFGKELPNLYNERDRLKSILSKVDMRGDES